MKLVLQYPGTKDSEHNNTSAPEYEMNYPLVDMVFDNGGDLNKKEAES